MAGVPPSRLDSLMNRMRRFTIDSSSSGIASMNNLLVEMNDLLKAKEAKKDERALLIKPALKMDVLFVLDATVSMAPNRDAVVSHLVTVVDLLSSMLKHSTVSIGVVAYRDFKLNPRFEVFPFTKLSGGEDGGLVAARAWLNKLKFHTNVSQDFPEDVHGGLEKACEMAWSSGSRTLIHIADAPGHGLRLAPLGVPPEYLRDDHPEFDWDGSQLRKILLRLREDLKVNTFAFMHVPTKIKGEMTYLTLNMVEKYREAASDPAWIQEFEWNNESFPFQVIESASESVRSSISFIKGQPFLERAHTLQKEEPDWNSIPETRVKVTKHRDIQSLSKLMAMIDGGNHVSTYEVDAGTIKIAPNPFAMGQSRLVYYGRYFPSDDNSKVAGEFQEYQEVVLKEFKAKDGAANKAVNYKAQMETHTVAQFLAKQFNEHASEKQLGIPEVSFVDCALIFTRKAGKERFMLMEELCIGPHVKFNNNCGSVNFNDPQPHLQAFSHWSYEITDKKLMVVDVQGFKELDSSGAVKIVLSDPALHSVSREHFNPLSGNMNLLNGPDMFLHSHTSPEINQKLYETMKIKLHGATCETLIPTCKEFRLNQDTKQRATSTAGNSHGQRDETPFRRLGHGRGQRQGRGQSQSRGQSQNRGQSRGQSRQRGGGERSQTPPRQRGPRSPSPRRRMPKPLPLESLSSANTESSVARRADIIKSSMKIHDQCRMLLRPKGIPVPNNLVAAIDLCFTEGLIDAATKGKWDQKRVLRNVATHSWND